MTTMPDKVKVKITVGQTSVEIEAGREDLEDSVGRVLSALRSAGIYVQHEEKAQPVSESEQKAVTCRRVIDEMLAEGWFREPRSLSAVASELSRRGFSYDRTAIAHVLLDMVRQDILRREGEARRYAYIEVEKTKRNTLGPSGQGIALA